MTFNMVHATNVSQHICTKSNNLPQRNHAPELHAISASGQQTLWFMLTGFLVFAHAYKHQRSVTDAHLAKG